MITRRTLTAGLAVAPLAAHAFDGAEMYPGERALFEAAAKEGMVVSFDTGPTWANWAAQFAAFKRRYPGVEIVYNDLGSAATVVALDKARNRPQADTAYYFAASAVDAVAKGLVAPFNPVNFQRLPTVLRHPDGQWFTIHQLVIAFVVNRKLAKKIPEGFADLLAPDFRNAVSYLDPRSTGVGQVGVFAAAFGNGGDMDNIAPGAEWFGKLHKAGNVQRVEGTTPYAKFVKGEIPVWIAYENDGLKAKYVDGMGDDCAVVIPKEASAAAPYAISLVKNGPNPNAGKLWLNWTMSDAGQRIFAEGFVRPSVPGLELPAEIEARMPKAPQVRPLDIVQASARKAEVDRLWAAAALTR